MTKIHFFQQVTQIDNDLKAKAAVYNNLKGSLQSLERKSTSVILRMSEWTCDINWLEIYSSGSLLTRNLADLVKKEDFVLDSEYLATLLVVVPVWVHCYIPKVICYLRIIDLST